jgi:oligopeptide/dipeptide ABC transporter ATP-binding protein
VRRRSGWSGRRPCRTIAAGDTANVGDMSDTQTDQALLEAKNLRVTFGPPEAPVVAVDCLSFRVAAGEVLGIVGESGCGKTATARSVIGLNRADPHCRVTGQVKFRGRDLLGLSERQMRGVRGREIAMIFQDPLTSLNPLQRIGTQIGEMLRAHTDFSESAIVARTIELLRLVGIPHPEVRIGAYPHQFSGGMRQRVMIAMAIACDPVLLIADEPTTALDVTMQMQILSLLVGLRRRTGMAMLLITHDFGVIAEVADRVMVMYAGQCVEAGEVGEIFRHPQHPYTAGLLASIPSAERPRLRRLPAIRGMAPAPGRDHPDGCRFRPRCDHAAAPCLKPPILERHAPRPDHPGPGHPGSDHQTRCWLPHQQLEATR